MEARIHKFMSLQVKGLCDGPFFFNCCLGFIKMFDILIVRKYYELKFTYFEGQSRTRSNI